MNILPIAKVIQEMIPETLFVGCSNINPFDKVLPIITASVEQANLFYAPWVVNPNSLLQKLAHDITVHDQMYAEIMFNLGYSKC